MKSISIHRRRAFTLLEVVLALGLSVIVLGLVGSQVYSTLSLVQHGRIKTEREQLARAIMHKIADDLRATVRYEPFDTSGLAAISSSSGSQGSGSGGGSSGGSDGGSGSGSGGGSSSGSSSGSGGGQSSSGSSSGSSSSSPSSSNPAPQYAGIYGDQYNLQIDISRIPRLEEYNSTDTSSDGSSPLVSDVRTVTYYVANSPAPTSTGSSSSTTSTSSSSSSSSSSSGSSSSSSGSAPTSTAIIRSSAAANMAGLVRSELNRSAYLWASQQGDTSSLDDQTVAMAPEVLDMEFSYYDGTNWNDTWDTTAHGGLPQAISISMVLDDSPNGPQQAQAGSAPTVSVDDMLSSNPEKVYRLVVRLPACDLIQASSSSTSSSSQSTGSTSNNQSGT